MRSKWLILIIGLPGCGKSTIAARLSEVLGASIISSERIRFELFQDEIASDRDFTESELRQTYIVMHLLARNLLQSGASAIVEGVFRSESDRLLMERTAIENSAMFLGIHVDSDEQTIVDRLRLRKQTDKVSPAGEATYFSLKRQFEKVSATYLSIRT